LPDELIHYRGSALRPGLRRPATTVSITEQTPLTLSFAWSKEIEFGEHFAPQLPWAGSGEPNAAQMQPRQRVAASADQQPLSKPKKQFVAVRPRQPRVSAGAWHQTFDRPIITTTSPMWKLSFWVKTM
jgi:hypothetical protein